VTEKPCGQAFLSQLSRKRRNALFYRVSVMPQKAGAGEVCPEGIAGGENPVGFRRDWMERRRYPAVWARIQVKKPVF
jgi:hypothetical protein